MKQIILYPVLLIVSALSCNPKKNEPIVCTQEAKASLNVTVKDAASGKLLGDSVTVLAQSASATYTLDYFAGTSPEFSGPFEQSGTFTLSVSRPGYKNYTSAPVKIDKDECHVIPQSLVIALEK